MIYLITQISLIFNFMNFAMNRIPQIFDDIE